MSTKYLNNYNKTFQITIVDILANAPFDEVSVLITNDNEYSVVPLLRTYNSHHWIRFSLNCLSFREGGSFDIGRPRSRGWKNFEHRWTDGWGILKIGQFSWALYAYHSLLYIIYYFRNNTFY